jgi:hypothetical protein
MSVTCEYSESNGVGETVHDNIANLNFGSNDSYEIVPSTYPVIAGTNSYIKYIRGKFTGTFTEISNIKFWKSIGAMATGEVITAEENVAYATPVNGLSGDAAVPTDVGSALSLNSAEGDPTIIYGASGVSGYTGYIRLQLQTSISTPPGAVAQKTFVMQYDAV